MQKIIGVCMLWWSMSSSLLYAAPIPTAQELMVAMDRQLVSSSSSMTIVMTSITSRRMREFQMKSYSRENEAVLEYLAPPREAGIRILKKGKELWMYFPTIERTQKISGYMLHQGMMGTDASYEDVITGKDFTSAYYATMDGEEDCGDGRSCWRLLLTAKSEKLAYPKRVVWVDKEYTLPVKQELYAASGMLMKRWSMGDIQLIEGDRYFPMRMEIIDELQQGTKTILELSDVKLGIPIRNEIFSVEWLEER